MTTIRLRLLFNIILACSLFMSAVALPLNATALSEDAKPNSAPGIEAFIEAINLYKGGQYASAIAEFEAAVAYFEETGQTGQITLAQKYITNAQSLLHEAESQSSGVNDEVNSVAVRVKQAAIPEPDRIAQSTSLVPEAATTTTETGQITDTATITLTPESPAEATTTEESTAAPTETETASTDDAAAEEEPAEPISLPAILCADTAIDDTVTPAELIPLATSFVDSGNQLHKEKKFDEAIVAYCNGLVIVAELGDATAAANTLAKLAESYKGAELDAETVSAYTTAADLYEAANLPSNGANMLAALGRYHRSAKRPTQAITNFRSAIALHNDLGEEDKRANVLAQLAEAHKDAGQDGAAVLAYEEAIALYKALDNVAGTANTLEAFARYQSSLERFENAIALNLEALEIRRELGEDNRTVGTVKQLADSYQRAGSDQAIVFYEEAIDLYLNIDAPQNAAGIYEALGRTAQAAEDFAQAISYFNEGFALRQEIGDDNATASSLNQLAGAYLKSGDETAALTAYDEVVTLYLKLDEAKKAADVVEVIARTEVAAERFDSAISRYQQAVEIRRLVGDDVATANTLSQLAKTLQATGDETTMVAVSEESASLFEAAGETEKAAAALLPTSTPTPTPVPTIFYVTPTTKPEDVFAAATLSAQSTAEVEAVGTPTPLPPNLRVARVIVQPNLEEFDNEATAVALSELATVQAQTTGVPEGYVAWTATPRTGIVYVTPTPRAPDIFAAATIAAQMTADAQANGPATALPSNWRIARIGVIPNLSDYENPATAVALSQLATAIAQTTGTPEGWDFWTATPRPPVIYVTPTPPAADIFAAATVAAQITAEAQTVGTATPLPPNWKVAGVRVIPNLSDYQNQATAVALVAFSTAVAQTTGTPEGLVYWTATPRPLGGGAEPTPVFLSASELTATYTPTPTPVVPQSLVGKILFLYDQQDGTRPSVYAMNPDTSGLMKLTSDEFYKRAIERNRSSADRRYTALNCRDACGAHGRLQIWYTDAELNTQSQLTFFGTGGNSWDMVWSPTGNQVAFVDNQTGGDEIYVVQPGEWPAKRLTENTWQWDHHPTWSPDGIQLVFSSNRDGRRQIWIMDADGGNQHRLTDLPGEAYNPVWVLYGDD